MNISQKGGRNSDIDLTFASPLLARNIFWKVSEQHTQSNKQAIAFIMKSKLRSQDLARLKIRKFQAQQERQRMRIHSSSEVLAELISHFHESYAPIT